MTLYLGIDGGGTGCRAAVADADGAILGRGAGGAANVFSDPEGARASVLAAAGTALEAAGRPAALGDLVAVLGLAGANVQANAARLEAGLPFARVRVVSDAAISVRGALGSGDGVTAALGTGSVFASQRAGAIRFIGGWGFLLGDHASGARIGRSLLETALLAHDGLTPGAPLLGAVIAEAGGPEALVSWARTAPPAAFAGFVPRILAAAEAGEPPAAAILSQADADIVAAVDRLMQDGPAPLCFLGGLGPVFERRLAGRYGALIRPARGAALDGALAMAREVA